jgi:hypothetical protein
MAVRSSAVSLFVHAAMVVGAILAVTILLAAMPGHNAPSVATVSPAQQQSAASQPVPSIPRGSIRTDITTKEPMKRRPSVI